MTDPGPAQGPPELPAGCRPVPGHARYAIGPDGRAWSCTYSGGAGGSRVGPWRRHRGKVGRRGYLEVKVGGRSRYVHDLVLEAFAGPRPAGLEACHGDGGRLDNSRGNLRYGSRVENMADAIRAGTIARGTRNARAKLTPSGVRAIRRASKAGRSRKAIAAMAGVAPSTVGRVLRRVAWEHVR
jgi:HNH endonuclease